jgi:NAD(P)-dependent dehydrogenase (short-subunit alcohol dehydrogenase family)
MRGTTERNAATVAAMAEFAELHDVDLRTVELDVRPQDSANAAVDEIISDSGRIDVSAVDAPIGARPFRVTPAPPA